MTVGEAPGAEDRYATGQAILNRETTLLKLIRADLEEAGCEVLKATDRNLTVWKPGRPASTRDVAYSTMMESLRRVSPDVTPAMSRGQAMASWPINPALPGSGGHDGDEMIGRSVQADDHSWPEVRNGVNGSIFTIHVA